MFNAFGEEYVCLLKRFLFLSIRRQCFIQFLRETDMEKVLQELLWVAFFGHPYNLNGTKIHLDATHERQTGAVTPAVNIFKGAA